MLLAQLLIHSLAGPAQSPVCARAISQLLAHHVLAAAVALAYVFRP
jgi:hypothetical protein